MAPDKPERLARKRKLGRGLSEVSHIFLSGAEKAAIDAEVGASDELWMPDASLLDTCGAQRPVDLLGLGRRQAYHPTPDTCPARAWSPAALCLRETGFS